MLSLLAALDPVRIGITALLIARPRPMLNLLVFWLGGMASGVAAAALALLALRDVTLSVTKVVVSASDSPIVVSLQAATGAVAIFLAARMLARFRARQRAPLVPSGGDSAVMLLDGDAETAAGRMSFHRLVERGSLLVTFLAGVALATPPVEYLAAIVAIVASEPGEAAQIGASLVFTLVAFTVVEVPLITYVTMPARTLSIVHRMNEWISARSQAIPAMVVGAIGVLLVAGALGRA